MEVKYELGGEYVIEFDSTAFELPILRKFALQSLPRCRDSSRICTVRSPNARFDRK